MQNQCKSTGTTIGHLLTTKSIEWQEGGRNLNLRTLSSLSGDSVVSSFSITLGPALHPLLCLLLPRSQRLMNAVLYVGPVNAAWVWTAPPEWWFCLQRSVSSMPDLLWTQTHSVLALLSQWQLERSAQGAQARLSCCQAALERSSGSRDTSSPVDPCECNTLLYRTCYPKNTPMTPQHNGHSQPPCLLLAKCI